MARARVRQAWAWAFGKISSASPFLGSHLVMRASRGRRSYVTRHDAQTRRVIREILAIEPMHDVRLSGTGKLMLLSRDRVYFVALGDVSDAAITASIRNWEALRRSPLADVVSEDWRRLDIAGTTVLSSERLVPCRNLDACGYSLLQRLWAEGEHAPLPRSSQDAWYRAVQVLTDTGTAERWRDLVRSVAAHTWRVGPTHGDMTPLNVMQRAVGNRCYLIDLDRFDWNRVQIFDALHYSIERHCKTYATDWIALLETEAAHDVIARTAGEHGASAGPPRTPAVSDLAALYALERVRHELRAPLSMMPSSWVRRVGRLLSMMSGDAAQRPRVAR